MRNAKIVILLALIFCFLLIGFYFTKSFFTTKTGGDYRNLTDIDTAYNADLEISSALERFNGSQEKASIIAQGPVDQRFVAITFDGLTDRTTMQRILDLLQKHNAKATFFVDGMLTAEDPQIVFNIKKEGQKIENYTLSGRPKMENLPTEKLIRDFCRAQKIIEINTDKVPGLLKCNNTKYNDQLLRAAKACGLNSVVKNDLFLNVKQINKAATADDFVRSVKPGSIISVQLKANTDPIVNEKGKTDDRPAVDKQPGLKNLSQQTELGEKEIVDAVEKLLVALHKANYKTAFVEDFSKYNNQQKPTAFKTVWSGYRAFAIKIIPFVKEQLAVLFTCRTASAAAGINNDTNEIKTIMTTEPALAFTFGGIAHGKAVDDILYRLNSYGIKSTFFLSETEMKRFPATVWKIINGGHEAGILINPKDGASLDETRNMIMRARNLLKDRFGVTTNLVKQPWGAVSDTTKEAVAGLQCKLIGQSLNIVQTKHKSYTSADQIITEVFGKNIYSLARGQILYFRMDFYDDDRLIGDLMEKVKRRKVDNVGYVTAYDNPRNNPANDSQYKIRPVGEMLRKSQYLYQYPVDPRYIPVHLQNNRSYLDIDNNDFLSKASDRYIGNDSVNLEDRMIGFSKMEFRRLDKTGMVNTEDNVIFLTFDDWGTDASINKILYVLRKHNAKGTFFIITHNVVYNPNLLRAIAVEGHEVGSHSDLHKPMTVRDPLTGKQFDPLNKEERIKDFGSSYIKLLNIIGDVKVNGKYSLTRFFRPPQLAVSRPGLEALFETGFEYIICGSGSTYDYKAENEGDIIKNIITSIYTKDGEVKKGAILVFHMSDTSEYTATALDILLTANDAKRDSDPSKFKVGRLSDYLVDGYSQINRKKSLRLQHDKHGTDY